MDVLKLIGAVDRGVQSVVRDGKPARMVVASRIFETDIQDAWDAVTNPKRIARWFAPISGELRLEGRYQVEGNASGTITTCEPPKRFLATWEFGGGVSWIEVRLTSEGEERTRLVLEHTAIIDDYGHWEKYGPGAAGVGWELGLLGLQMHIESKGESITKEGEAWAMSDEGRRFQKLSSEAWGEASILFGTDATLARAAADRTTAFYTGGE
jgi:uncharacterized protein YndB with AHSA1/START domain